MTDHKKAMAAEARAAVRRAEQKYKLANPDAERLRLRADVAAYRPRPKAMRSLRVRAAGLLIGDRHYLNSTNAAIATFLSADEPGYSAPPNLLTESFTATEKTQVARMLAERGVAIDLARIDSPSKLKKALKARLKSGASTDCVAAEIAFTDDSVIVNGRSYPINGEGRLARIQVGKGKLNVHTLGELFRRSEI